jgi:hypothetical protein
MINAHGSSRPRTLYRPSGTYAGRAELYELIGKPYDLDHVVAAVRRAVLKTGALRARRDDPQSL